MIESFKLPNITPETLTGSIVSFNDEYGGLPLKSCVSQIQGWQEGSGIPSPQNKRPLHAFSSADLYFNTINQWDEQWEVGGISDTTGGNVARTNRIRSKNYIQTLANTTYYARIASTSNIFICEYDANKTFIRLYYAVQNTTFITGENTHFIRFYVQPNYGTTYNNDISINYPATDTSYHAFSGAVFTFGQSIYQGSIDWLKGVVRAEWGVVDLGTLDWFPISNAYYADIVGKKNGIGNLLCSSYPIYTATPSLADMPDKMIKGGSGDNRAYAKDSSYPDASSFKTAMNGVMLAYELATPIEIPLGGINLLTQEGQNNIFCDTGDTEVTHLKVT